MKILAWTPTWFPRLGGMEIHLATLLTAFVDAGHDVRLVTTERFPDPAPRTFPFPVHRRPGVIESARLMRWCDVFFQQGLALASSAPGMRRVTPQVPLALLFRRPWVTLYDIDVALARPGREASFLRRLIPLSLATALWKELMARSVNVAVSDSTGKTVPALSTTIPSCYHKRFDVAGDGPRSGALFVGRLERQKGCQTLLQAVGLLRRERGLDVPLTVAGDGPHRRQLESAATEADIRDLVNFRGPVDPDTMPALMKSHEILVVPSAWREACSLVVLEGMASGCAVIVSDAGALPTVVGPGALTFRAGDKRELADAVARVLRDEKLRQTLRSNAADHVTQFRPAVTAARHLALMEAARRTGWRFPEKPPANLTQPSPLNPD